METYYTLQSVLSFLFLTVVYSIIRQFIKSRKHLLFLFAGFFFFVILFQCIFATIAIKTKCTVDPNNPHYDFYPVFFHCFLPWFFLFGIVAVLVEAFPVLLQPFSNTFGYLVVKIMGVSSVVKKLVRSDFYSQSVTSDSGLKALSDALQDIRDKDDSLFVNLFNSTNFDEKMSVYDNAFDKSNTSVFEMNVEAFKRLVTIKENVSKTIWYVLSGLLASSISSVKINSWKCKRSLEDIKKIHNKK